MAGGGTAATASALTATLGLAVASWVVAVGQMAGMDMGVATTLGSLGFFLPLWIWMMAAMMLPGATPVVARRANARGVRAVPLFLVSYLAVWAVVGVAVYALHPAARRGGRRRGGDRGRSLRDAHHAHRRPQCHQPEARPGAVTTTAISAIQPR